MIIFRSLGLIFVTDAGLKPNLNQRKIMKFIRLLRLTSLITLSFTAQGSSTISSSSFEEHITNLNLAAILDSVGNYESCEEFSSDFRTFKDEPIAPSYMPAAYKACSLIFSLSDDEQDELIDISSDYFAYVGEGISDAIEYYAEDLENNPNASFIPESENPELDQEDLNELLKIYNDALNNKKLQKLSITLYGLDINQLTSLMVETFIEYGNLPIFAQEEVKQFFTDNGFNIGFELAKPLQGCAAEDAKAAELLADPDMSSIQIIGVGECMRVVRPQN